ncbi:MAG: hypothetical protein A2252_06870 [Elusimicrobia bacterium RIFOXYA2_FULL_39_19]|nr:MAG: hypothetical protein A2252_06870 [Elusimicrobia bacterium RIFOXYA2_FULL_39_19]
MILKKIGWLTAIMVLLNFGLVCTIEAKTLTVLDTENGEMPNSISDNSSATFSDEYEGEIGMALKITLVWKADDKPWGWTGVSNPKRSWAEFDKLCFDAYNPTDEMLSLSLTIRDMPASQGKPFDEKFVLKPGKNEIEIELSGAKSSDGHEIDFAKLVSWAFTGVGDNFKEPKIFYVSNIRLATSDEVKKGSGKKETKKKVKKKEVKKAEKKTVKKAAKKSSGKTTPVINIENGENLVNISENSEAKISTDFEDEIGEAYKITLAWKAADKPWGWAGMGSPKGSWAEYNMFKFDAYNSGKELLTISLQLRDMPASQGAAFTSNFVLQPGKNEVVIELAGAKCGDGHELDLSKLTMWCFTAAGETIKEPKTFYITNIRLEE